MNPKYRPVVKAKSGHYRGAALVGTHSAIIGWTLDDPKLRKGLHGFAIRRSDINPDTGEVLRLDWLGGYKRFKETDDGRATDVRSIDGPFQRFRWNDYTLNADLAYKYEVFPMRGKPEKLKRDGRPMTFNIRPSYEDTGDLGVFVNRGVTAAMAYMQRFQNRPPDEVGPAAYKWLSRGLKESLINFIDKTKSGQTLHVAIYEFFDHEVAGAFKAAKDRGVNLSIVHDAKKGKHSTEKSKKVLKEFKLTGNAIPRTTVNISHNKVVIRLVKNKPKEVWTGSANFSENAFNFQTNTALIVRDLQVAQHFEDYFQALTTNPAKAESKKANRIIMDRADAMKNRFAERTFFSPISSNDILECSSDLISSAKSAVFVSAPFGVDKSMIAALNGNSSNIIEYGLSNTTAKRKIEKLRVKNTRFYPPNKLTSFMGKEWDARAFGAHKIHAKTVIIDPWSSNPKVLIGSANFSKNSCRDNDENAMLITGDKRLTAILTTEFMRMYDHYKSRFYIRRVSDKNKEIKAHNKRAKSPKPLLSIPKHLSSNGSWSNTAFNPNSRSHKFRDRVVFAGDE